MNKNSVLEKINKVLEKHTEDTTTVVLLAIEFNEEGLPVCRLNKIQGSGCNVMAGLQVLQRTLTKEIETWHEKIEMITEISEKMDNLFSKIGVDGLDDPQIDKIINSTKDEEIKKSLKEAIARLKNQFGK